MIDELDAVIECFRRESAIDFAYLPIWFGDVLAKYDVPEDGFDRRFIANLAYAGWFIFCVEELMPKLHSARCFVDLAAWSPVEWLASLKQRNSRAETGHIKYRPFVKRLKALFQDGKRLTISCSTNFREALATTNRFHGISWIETRLAEVLIDLNERPEHVCGTPVQALSWELQNERGDLMAADIGYRVGAIYASMSGFSDRRYPSIGILELVAQAMLLQEAGFQLWDLGQCLPYKLDLGATSLTPEAYLPLIRRHRTGDAAHSIAPSKLNEMEGFRRMLEIV